MKKLLYILSSIFILSCASVSTEKADVHEPKVDKVTDSNNEFYKCFLESDTIVKQSTVGCSGDYYKIISDQYVLRISSDLNVEYNHCAKLNIDSLDQTVKAELIIFEKGESNLTNICTDLIIVNTAQPIKTLKKCYGQITIGKSDSTYYYGSKMPKTTIKIDQLIFRDPQTGENIKIENELFWKVLNTGTPG